MKTFNADRLTHGSVRPHLQTAITQLHRLVFKFSTWIGIFFSEKKKSDKPHIGVIHNIKQIQRSNLLLFMGNISIYSPCFKERHQQSAEILHKRLHCKSRKNQFWSHIYTHTHTHTHTHTQAVNINAACRCCISANHTHIQQREQTRLKIQNQRHVFVWNRSAVHEERRF